ncbi:hypothetical protein SCLCIDRAFT_346766 [Scleroderma citrinum Foug A]|uniref:Uncharacterized protein n=1 Tax=Scleroderma citrinum Foug A TaxID=1036808 RepID=A0A0C3D1Q3_9AGAM|nr:hypothetical protein SCLCIDRAFT_346766 [Scleroderma citrinum Foug A]
MIHVVYEKSLTCTSCKSEPCSPVGLECLWPLDSRLYYIALNYYVSVCFGSSAQPQQLVRYHPYPQVGRLGTQLYVLSTYRKHKSGDTIITSLQQLCPSLWNFISFGDQLIIAGMMPQKMMLFPTVNDSILKFVGQLT